MKMCLALILLSIFSMTIHGEGLASDIVFGDAMRTLDNPEDMARHNRVVDEQINRLRNQVSICENNLSRHETEDNLVVQDLPLIRFVGEINANLASQPGKVIGFRTGGVDYDEYGCDRLIQTLGLPERTRGLNINARIVAASGGSTLTSKMNLMCEEQKKLHECFSKAEDIIRENDIAVHDLDRSSPIPGFDYGDVRRYYPNRYQTPQSTSLSN